MPQILNNALILLGGFDLSRYLSAAQIDGEREVYDITGFQAGARERAMGFKSFTYAATGFYDPLLTDKPHFDSWGQQTVMTIAAGTNVGDVAYSFYTMREKYGWGAEIGGAATIVVSGQAIRPPLSRGRLLHHTAAPVSTTFNGSALEAGAVLSTQRLVGVLHVWEAGGAPTLNVRIQSDDESGFNTPTDRLTFSQMTAPGAELKDVSAGAVTDTWWRIVADIGGSTPSLRFCVTLGFVS